MVFSSILFLCVYLPAVLILYALCPRRARNLFLLVASLLFYAWGEPKFVLLMLVTITLDYVAGRILGQFRSRERTRAAKTVLALSVVCNLGLLAFFKYTDFLIRSVNSVAGTQIPLLEIALPIGISFYTFQALSYVIDVYRGRVTVQKNYIDFAMYVTLFPQLIAGPIVRYSDVEAEMQGRTVTAERYARGICRFLVGLGKKVLIANRMGAWFSDITGSGTMTAAGGWLATVAFGFQIYFDFSGYSDMAIGLGHLFGFDFPENFRYPYEADSITEFWRRWHITLSSWFREYLYIPLGGNRKGLPRQIFNLAVVWFLTGLWHGAGWNFILWGLYFAVILVAEKLFLLKFLEKLPRAVRHLYAILMVQVSWVIFASESLSEMGAWFASLVGVGGWGSGRDLYLLSTRALLLAVAAVGATHFPAKLGCKLMGTSDTPRRRAAVFALYGAYCIGLLAVSLAFLAGDSYNPFLYFRF